MRRQIAALEAALGLSLFTRAANGLTPTRAALDLAPMADGLAAQASAFQRAADAARGTRGGTVRLTASRVIATHVMPQVLASLRQHHPDIRIELVASDLPEDLPRRAADIAVRLTPPTQEALVAKRLPDIMLGLYASGDHLVRHSTPADHDALTHWPFVGEDRETRIADGFAARGLPAPANLVLRSDDALVQIASIAAGLGIGFCQSGIAARLDLRRVLPEIAASLPCHLVMHEDQRDILPIRTTFDHLATALPHALAEGTGGTGRTANNS